MDTGAYKYNPEPVALVGENLKLLPLDRYVKILYIEGLPAQIKDFGPIAASSTLALSKLTEIDMPEDEIAQVRFKVLDPIEVEVYQKRAVGRFSTRNVLIRMTPDTGTINDKYNVSEMFVYEDEAPWMQVYNPAAIPITTSRILFEGFRYVVETLPGAPDKYTAIPVYGWGTRGD